LEPNKYSNKNKYSARGSDLLAKAFNLLTPGAFCRKPFFLDILAVFRLDFGQISFNLVENAFATQQLAVLATSMTFYEILARACTDIKILNKKSEQCLE